MTERNTSDTAPGAASDTARTAPDPEDPRKPDSPTELEGASWMFTARAAWAEFRRDDCTDLAAGLTYYSVLAIFPALVAIVSLLGIFGQESTVNTVVQLIEDLGQPDVAQNLRGPIQQIVDSQASGFAFVLGLAGALWSASGYIGAFGRSMNRIYEVDEGRPFWKLRPLNLVLTVVAVVLAAAVLIGAVVTGPFARELGDALGVGSAAVTTWRILKWPLMLGVVVLLVALLYYATPNVRQPKFRWMSVGAALAIVVWLLASGAFAVYVATFSSYNKTYGSLAGVIVFLLWLWLTNLSLLFGAEVDSELERARQLEAGIPAEESLQLPPRDTKASDKQAQQLQEQVERGRELREDAEAARGSGDADGAG